MKIFLYLQEKVVLRFYEVDDLKRKKGFLTLLFPLTTIGIISDNLVPVGLLAYLGEGCPKHAVVPVE
jgi:hypothetical protein